MDEVTGETARQKAEQSNILQIQKLHDRGSVGVGSNPTTKNTNKNRARRSQSNAAAIAGLQSLAPEKSDEKEEASIDPNPSEPIAAEAGLAAAPSQKTPGEKLIGDR